MADTTSVTPAPKKRRGWLRAIAWVFGVLVVLLVVLYFVATSSGFLTGVILPRVSKAMNAQITLTDASISPFSQVVLRGLKVQTTGPEPLVSAAEVRLRYSLMDIIKGNIHVDEVTVASPTVTLIENADGTSNLDPLLKAQPKQAAPPVPVPAAKPAAGKPLQIDLKKFALTDATIRRVQNYKDGKREVDELSHVNVTLDDLKNGQTGKLALGADISVQQTNATLQAKLTGNFTLALAADLKPASIKGSTRLDVTKAEGALAEAAGFGTELNVEVTPTDVKDVALRFQKGTANLGELRVSGPFDMQKLEGRLSIVLAGIDKQLLNLAGTKNGMDFGSTTISSTNEVALAQGGMVITAKGQLDVNSFQLTRTNQTTPRLDLREAYDVTVDRSQSSATMRSLTMTGTENGNAFLKAELTSPMQISWGNVSNAVGDSALTLTVTSFNLADWKPFVGDVAPAGTVSMTAKVLSQQGGKQVTLGFDSRIEHLTVNAGSNHIADATITVHADAKAADLKQFNLTDYKLEVAHQNETLTTVTASGTYDQATEAADMQVAVQAALAPLLRTMPQPGMTISSGTVELKAHVTQKQKTQAVTGNFALADFSGRFGTNEVRGLGTAVDFDVGMASQQVQIRKLAGKLTQGGNAAGSFDVSGTYDSGTTNADVQATAQLVLAALLQAAPQPAMSVTSGTIELKTHVTQKQKTQAVTGSLALADFSGRFGTNELRSLGMAVDFDVGMTAQQAQIRKLTGKLTQGANVGGSFDVSATYDFVKTNANLTAKLTDFNQNWLGPFLEPALGGKKLVSVAINGNATAQYDAQGASAVKADFQMTNLVVKDPKGQFPATPLEAKMQMDASLRKQVADVRQFQITLTPTARATNQVQLSGQVDMSQTNAIQGNLKLVADSLDFTSYYDLFMGGKPTPATGTAPTPSQTAATPAPATAPADANKEPEPIKLPLSNFTAQASIGRLYLHEVEITNWQTTTKIDGGHVVVNPFKLTLNGAPVSATVDLDLGVTGWKYDTSLSAQAIPLAPLVNSFQPERKGQIGGTLTAQAQLKGAGITGASLQKNLAGQFDVNTTNLNLNVVNIKSSVLKTLVNVVAGIPELLSNPAGKVSSLIGGLTGKAGTSGGLADDLQRSPINSIIVQGTAGAGRIELKKAVVQSPAFEADASSGTVTLAAVLTNSVLQIPVAISLSRPIAQRMSLVPAGTPASATYAKLPDFFTMTGTVGAPKSKIDYLALAGTAGKSVTGALQGLGGNVGGALGNILGTTPAATTNQPAATQSPVNSLINGLFGPKKK
jgi:uncharacterized protein involved in outer membrane biogenesis